LRPADRKIWLGRYRNGCQGVAFHIEQFFSVSAPGRLASAVGRDLPLSAAVREICPPVLQLVFARTARIRTRCRLASASDTRDRFGSLDPHLINKKSPVWRPIIRYQNQSAG
jgi:hypothetical protein